MKCNIFLMILNSKKHEGQVPEMELALLFQISLLLYTSIQVSQVRELIKLKKLSLPTVVREVKRLYSSFVKT